MTTEIKAAETWEESTLRLVKAAQLRTQRALVNASSLYRDHKENGQLAVIVECMEQAMKRMNVAVSEAEELLAKSV